MRIQSLKKEFFERSAVAVARDLIGKFIQREGRTGLMITETEAYEGPDDKASHARHGRTERNAPLYMPAGTIYVYRIYGVHWMLNVVCGAPDHPAAVLLRSAGEVTGPGRLAKALAVDQSFNAKPLGPPAGLWVEDRHVWIDPAKVAATPRIGIGYAGDFIDKPWRFLLKG